MIEDVRKKVGERVKKARKICGISQEELAERVNVSVTTISRLETGRQMVSVEKLLEIEEALNVGIETLLLDFIKVKPSLDDGKEQEIVYLLSQCSERQKEYVVEQVRLMMKYSEDLKGQL